MQNQYSFEFEGVGEFFILGPWNYLIQVFVSYLFVIIADKLIEKLGKIGESDPTGDIDGCYDQFDLKERALMGEQLHGLCREWFCVRLEDTPSRVLISRTDKKIGLIF